MNNNKQRHVVYRFPKQYDNKKTDKDYENEFSEELSTDYRQLQLEKNQTKVYTSKPKKTNKGKDCK